MRASKPKSKSKSPNTARHGVSPAITTNSSVALNRARPTGHYAGLAGVQRKVRIGPSNDAYEQEADAVASRVVGGQQASRITPLTAGGQQRMAESKTETESVQRQPEQDNDSAQTQSEEEIQSQSIQREQKEETAQTNSLQRQSDQESDEVAQTKLIQRQDDQEDIAQTSLLQRQDEESEVQSKGLQRQQDEQDTAQTQTEEDTAQTQHLQRQDAAADEEVRQKAESDRRSFESNLSISRSGGEPLPPHARSNMESRFHADFSGVRVHADSKSAQMNKSIGARAFTYGNHIYFNRGEFSPHTPRGGHLLAHELTHTVQQGASPSRAAAGRSPAAVQRVVQRSWLGDAWGAVSGAVSSAVEWVGDSLSAAVDYIKDQARDFIREVPGYRLLTVVLGRDPITGDGVARNGRNFIEAGLDVIPNGESLKRKLEKEGALGEAAQWLDEQIAVLDISPTEIGAQLRRFWNGLEISDVGRLREVLNEFAAIFRGPIERLVQFARNVAVRLLQIIKDYVVSSLINFIREQTSAYPLLTVILGRDPISNEPVERTPIALLRGFMQLSESGTEQLRQMEESGSLQRAADWLDGAIARLNISWELIRSSFERAWDLVTIQNLLDPIGTFRELYNIFAAPVGRIVGFLIEVAAKILGFIKDALIARLIEYARTIRGYPLLTVILGKDPFSQEPVERNAENIIHGFMSLMENGEQQFQDMKQSGAIERLTTRIETAIATLNFTWEYIRGLFTRAWNRFSLQDLAAPIEAFRRLMNIFGEPLLRLINFVVEIIKIVIEVIMQIMNFPIDLIQNIITRAMQAIEDIKRDPIGFLKNLVRAIKTGFEQFFGNILTHLLNGLTGWLFGELEDAGISPPTDLSFRSILGFVLEVLGITVEKIWEKLAERIGRERVEQIRSMIDRLTGIWSFVSDVMTRGPIAIWEYIQERLSNLWDTVLEAIRNWVMTRIVERVTARLLTMLDPTGIMAVVNGCIAFYNAVQSFIRYLREMLEIVNSFVVGVAELARGNVTIAANFLENSLAQAMPVAIGFLANQVGLSGIGRRVGEMIERVRGMVDEGLTWLVDRAVSAGTAFLNSVRSALGLGGPGAAAEDGPPDTEGIDVDNVIGDVLTVSAEGEAHTLYIDRSGTHAQIMMRSGEKTVLEHFGEMPGRINAIANPETKQQAQTHLQQGESKRNELQTLADEEASLTEAAQSGSENSGQNASRMSEVENSVRVKENELKLIIQDILNLVNEDVREALAPYLNQPFTGFETALNNDAEGLGLAKYYRTYSVNGMRIIARRRGQSEAAPRLRVVNDQVVEHDGRAIRHWEGILNYSNGQHSSGWLGAVSGGETAPSASFVTHGLDARGHLIGSQFTGSNSPENLAAQQRTANSPTYTGLENPLKQLMVRTSMAVKMDVQATGSTSKADWQSVFSNSNNVNLVSTYRNRSGPPQNYNDADVSDSYVSRRPAQYDIRITHLQRVASNGVIANAGESGSDIGTVSFNSTVTNPVEDDRASLSNGIGSLASVLEDASNKFNEQDT